MDEAERTAALARLREADAACVGVQIELAELDATTVGVDDDHPTLASWPARRADLLRRASEHAERAAVLYAALYVRNGTQDPVKASGA